ncbi:hypothetical protein V8B55DRAFT_1482805 [Mucor lusitanicus]|uniref:VHS domain-containing protein n=1 Tax=Mucor lusitanicus CBS 277.49 TaxID=747725 RepID=A0A168I103_MUCCL|nr:hypothetical protein MUCCIDRAFT_114612 [Mucor lusitanicus CBS 277.49]
MYGLKNSLSFRRNDDDVQRLIKKATHHTNVDEDWNLFIKICTEVNCTKGANHKARIALSKYLCAFKEPQTQYLAFSLLREICTNCGQFEVELRNQEFVALIRDLWFSNIHQKVRDNFALCISIWVNAYRDDLYFHHLINFCNSVYARNGIAVASAPRNSTVRAQAWYRQSSLPQPQSPPLSPNTDAPIDHVVNVAYTPASPYQDSQYTPNNPNMQQRNNHIDDNGSILSDIQRPARTSSVDNPFLSPSELHASASSSTSNRDTAFNMILRTSRSVPTTTNKGKARLNAVTAMSRHDMDALIYEAETAAKLLTDLTEGPIDSNDDMLEDLHQNCRSIHARIIKQLWSLEGDQLYHDALTDSARGLFNAITQYKKAVSGKLLIEVQ